MWDVAKPMLKHSLQCCVQKEYWLRKSNHQFNHVPCSDADFVCANREEQVFSFSEKVQDHSFKINSTM